MGRKTSPNRALPRLFRRSWERAYLHEQELLHDIEVVHKAGDTGQADFAARRYLRSYDARLVAVTRGWRKLPQRHRPPLTAIPTIARELNLWEACDEDVHIKLKPKRSNPHYCRAVMDFGIRHRARQYLLMAVLAARTDLSPNQYFYQGGTTTAIRKVCEALKSDYRYVTEIDISNCFDSFDPNEIPDLLPLPKEVTNLTVLSRTFHLIPYPDDNLLTGDFETSDELREFLESLGVQWGIPQGSAISSLIAERLLAPAIAQLPDCGVVVAFADNTLLMARSSAERASMQKSLLGALKTHPAGPLMSNRPKHYGPGDAVEFLGHLITIENGAVRVTPSDENLYRFRTTFKRKVSELRRHPSSKRFWKLRRFVRSWSAAFKLWDGVEQHQCHYLKEAGDLKAQLHTVRRARHTGIRPLDRRFSPSTYARE